MDPPAATAGLECRFKCGYVGETRNAENVHVSKKHRGQRLADYSPPRIECRYKCGVFCKTKNAEITHASAKHRSQELSKKHFNTWCMEENCNASVSEVKAISSLTPLRPSPIGRTVCTYVPFHRLLFFSFRQLKNWWIIWHSITTNQNIDSRSVSLKQGTNSKAGNLNSKTILWSTLFAWPLQQGVLTRN